MMKLMVAIPVYNREQFLEITARSLYECSSVEKTDIKVFNDCSTDFDTTYLKQLFNTPNAEVVDRKENLKSNRNTYQIMFDFLNTNNDILFICDSDLMLRPDTLDYIFDNFNRTDGFLGLYNSYMHRDLYFDGEFVYKEDVGFAGICVSRELLKNFTVNQKDRNSSMDFRLSDLLIKNGIRLMVPKNGLVEHIGFDGENANNGSMDFSTDFTPLSDFNKEVMNKIIPIVLKGQGNTIKDLLFDNKYMRFGFMLHQPHKYFIRKRNFKKLIELYKEKESIKK
jgi:glycosyltransferase involved in cell wall biosynthesis